MPHSVLLTVSDHCTPAIRGEDDDFHVSLLMYAAPPCDYIRRRLGHPRNDLWTGAGGFLFRSLARRTLRRFRTWSIITYAPASLFATFNPSSSKDLGAFLPLSPRLYPLLQALRVQDNTVHSHIPFAGRTAQQPEPG